MIDLQLQNLTSFPIQIWDGDYAVEGSLDNRTVMRGPHKAATGYLYIERPRDLIQDVIPPGAFFSVSSVLI